MPYGRKTYRSSYRHTRRSTGTRKMAVKPPPKKKTTRSYLRKSIYAVNDLHRDVQYLKRARYGQIQKNLHILTRPLIPTATQPVFCCVNDLSAANAIIGQDGAPWYQLDAAGNTNNLVSYFEPNNNSYYDKMNADILDTGCAWVNEIKLTFRIFCEAENGVQISNKRVRIDFFKQKSRALVTPTALVSIQQLPAVAAQRKLRNLANPALNAMPSEYFTRIGSRWVTLNPSKNDDNNKGTGLALKYCSYSIPKKYLGRITQQYTSPVSINDAAGATVGSGFLPENMPISQRIWCCVSSDDPNTFPSTDPEIQVQVQRYCSWRDTLGSAAL